MEVLTLERKNQKSKERGNGEGTIYYSKTLNKYVAQYIEPHTLKRKTITQRKNEKISDFKNRFRDIIVNIKNDNYISDVDISLYSILTNYIENNYKIGIISDRTYSRNQDTLKLLEKCCKDFIYKPIQKVNLIDIKKSLPNFVEFNNKQYSKNTISKLFGLLNKGFSIAVNERVITFNLINNVAKPKSKKKEKKIEALTVDEEKLLVEILKTNKHKYNNIILLAVFTGMRIGEVLALTRNNIDLQQGTIHVEKTLTRDRNDKVILGNKTKTLAGERTIYLSNNAISVVKDILSENLFNVYNLIFYDYQNNMLISPNEINCYLQRLNEKYNICSHIHTHMLRHTYATRCIEAGMSAKVLQKQLGHKRISTTLDTYTSVFEKFNQDENEKYNTYMKEIGL